MKSVSVLPRLLIPKIIHPQRGHGFGSFPCQGSGVRVVKQKVFSCELCTWYPSNPFPL